MGHGVGFALELVGVVDPVGGTQEGATGVAGGLEVFHLGLEKGEFAFGERGVVAGLFVPKEREGFAPVTLAGEEPVAEFELDFAGAFAFAFQPVDDFGFGFFGGQLIKIAPIASGILKSPSTWRPDWHILPLPVYASSNVDQHTAAWITWSDNLSNWEAELFGEFEVAFVVGGDGHDGSGAVAHHHVVRDPDGDGFLVDGVDGVGSGEDAAFVFVEVAAFEIGFVGAGVLVGLDCVSLFGAW